MRGGMGPLRKVCRVEEYPKAGWGPAGMKLDLVLECGHTIRIDKSAYRGGRVHCPLCPAQAGRSR